MWVRILAVTVVLVYFTVIASLQAQEYKWAPARVEVDIVFEKVFGALR